MRHTPQRNPLSTTFHTVCKADRVETLLFGGDEVLREFSQVAIRFVKNPSDAVMLDIALGLSK